MNNTKANFWLAGKKAKDITFSYESKQKFRLVKGSVLAIVAGIIIGAIVVGAQGAPIFGYLKLLFTFGFGSTYGDSTIQWWCIYIIATLAVGIGFKSGLFNMGVSGQMQMGAGLSIIFFQLVVSKHTGAGEVMNAGYIIVIFLICTFSGVILAGIAGVLKALFNIHEVVTTLMLNYATLYLMKFLFQTYDSLKGPGIASSPLMPGGTLTMNGSTIAFPILFAIIAVIVVSILLSKTTFGFKLKAVGASPDASKYAGYNVKAKMIDAMLISGLLAGVASFINVFTISPNISVGNPVVPTTGFDAVAITLIAFNNPLGTVAVSFMWSILESVGPSVSSMYGLPSQMNQLIFGILIYFAAISVVFINWYPILKLKIMIALSGSKADQVKIKNLRKDQLKYREQLLDINKAEDVQQYKAMIEQQIVGQKELLNKPNISEKQKEAVKTNISNLKKDMNYFVKEYRKNLKEQVKKINQQIRNIKTNNYAERINSAKEGINRRKYTAVKEVETDAISKAELINSNLLSLKDKYSEDLKTRKNWMKNKLRSLKKEYKLRQKQNAVWLESETGIKNHYWEMRNGKAESRAVINKIKIEAHNEILNIKSDYEMNVLSLRSKYKNKPEAFKAKQKVLYKKMQEQITKVNAKKKSDIQKQHEKVRKLVETYKTTKKANEDLARQIVNKKKTINSKLYSQSPIKKELVHQSGELLSELYFENVKDIKAVEKINEKNDTEGASLVDIRLAYNQRRQRTKIWYKEERERAINKHNEFVKQYDDQKSSEVYKSVKNIVADYNNTIKQFGNQDTLESISEKKKLLKTLITNVKKIWPEEYSNTDRPKWSRKRMHIYNVINKEQAQLDKIATVIIADNKIKNINGKYKWINQMYKDNIKGFKNQYLENKKVDVIAAQKRYHVRVESFIRDLEKYDFVSSEQLKGAK